MSKSIKILILTFVVCVFFSGTLAIFADKKMELEKDYSNKQSKSPKHIELLKKTKIRVDGSWEDIKKQFNIKEEEYIQIDFKQLNDFNNGKIEGFEDTTYCKKALKAINHMGKNPQVGSIKPMMLFSKDKSKVIYAFKDKNGKNYLRTLSLNEKYFNYDEEAKQGKKVKNFADIDIVGEDLK